MDHSDKNVASETLEQDELVDVEEYGKRGEKPPKARRYRIRIDKTHHEIEQSSMTGSQILAIAGKTPTSHFLDQKVHGGTIQRIEPGDVVDFTQQGIERFMTLPRSETEGVRVLPSRRGSGACA